MSLNTVSGVQGVVQLSKYRCAGPPEAPRGIWDIHTSCVAEPCSCLEAVGEPVEYPRAPQVGTCVPTTELIYTAWAEQDFFGPWISSKYSATFAPWLYYQLCEETHLGHSKDTGPWKHPFYLFIYFSFLKTRTKSPELKWSPQPAHKRIGIIGL